MPSLRTEQALQTQRAYSIDTLIKKHGAAGYLQGLRNRYHSGTITLGQFCLSAAQAYLIINKPYRARSLLDHPELKNSMLADPAPLYELRCHTEQALSIISPRCSILRSKEKDKDK